MATRRDRQDAANVPESKASGDVEDEAEFNPFRLPSDTEVFALRERERAKKKEQRAKANKLKLHERKTGKSKFKVSLRREKEKADDESKMSERAKATRRLVSAATTAINTERRREKENMTDFIAKKREMFLVQMSLDTKREEIRKLEEKAQMKEEALKKSELMLEEDAIRFDTFLKENDKKAHEAIKRAEMETKAKQEKVQEIKKLNQQIQLVQSEMSKLNEQLEDCMRYKNFLDSLTPPEWFEKQAKILAEKMREEQKRIKAEKIAEYHEKRRIALEKYEKAKKEEQEARERSPRSSKRGKGTKLELKLPPAPIFDEAKLGEVGEAELPMHFTDPQQLLEIFTQLEEQNLFLIQNSQETEQALEELKQEFRDTRRRMDSKTKSLKENMEALQSQIRDEDAKAQHLRERRHLGSGGDAEEGLLRALNERVREVYERCGFDTGSTPATLTMLTDLEAKLEGLLARIETMPQDYVVKAEKVKESKRRERVRAERMAHQAKIYEEKLQKSIARSMQAPPKKIGKMVMFRSAPPTKRERKRDNEDKEEEDKDAEFFKW